MIRVTAPTRISFALASLCMALLCAAEAAGLLPNGAVADLERRRAICEMAAVHAAAAAQQNDFAALNGLLSMLVARKHGVVAAKVRRANGDIAAEQVQTGEPPPSERLQVVRTPLKGRNGLWGSLEISFEQQAAGPWNWLGQTTRLMIAVTLAMFFASRFYLRRILQHLDPSSVIPERVRAMLDTLAEGVLVLDQQQRIVLANRSFADKADRSPDELQGMRISAFRWSAPDDALRQAGLPWRRAIDEGITETGAVLGLQLGNQPPRIFVINATPIGDRGGKSRGAVVTFDDITQIEQKNYELEEMLKALEVSREDIRRQNEKLEVLATRDPLTGCLNRRALFSQLELHWTQANAQGLQLACIMLDIDHFKSINDRFGHSIGDEVLKSVAQVLHAVVAEQGVVGRFGGEEFCIGLARCSPSQAAAIAEQVRARIAATTMNCGTVTASLGVSSFGPGLDRLQVLIDQADQALYYSKKNGRNRVTAWNELPAGWDNQQAPEKPCESEAAAEPDPQLPSQVLNVLMSVLAFRDRATADHCRRVASFCSCAAGGWMEDRDRRVLEVAALLHDIGKLGVPDQILLKPGPLSRDEWRIMSTHDRVGVEILRCADFCPEVLEIVASHHAHYAPDTNEHGSPTGEGIPLGARLLAIADAYDSMVSDRVYRKGRPRPEAFADLRRCAGKQFDPVLVEKFIEAIERAEPVPPAADASVLPSCVITEPRALVQPPDGLLDHATGPVLPATGLPGEPAAALNLV